MIYFVILGLSLFFAIVLDNKRKTYRKQYWFLCVILVLFMGLRYNVGGDSLAYTQYFDESTLLNQLTYFDLFQTRYPPLWVILVSSCKTLFEDFWSLQLIQSSFINVVLFSFFEKNTDRKFTAVTLYLFLYFLNFNTETMRAACSVAFFIIGYYYYSTNKWGLFYLFVLLAIGFHYEALPLLLLPLAKLMNTCSFNIKFLAIVSIIAILLTLSGDLVPAFSDFFKESVVLYESISYYTDNIGENNLNGYVAYYLMQVPYLFFIWDNRNKISKDILTMAILFVVLSLLALSFGMIMSRTRELFSPFVIILMSKTIGNIKTSRYMLVKIFAIVSLSVVLIIKANYYLQDERWKLWFPYSSIFNPQDSPGREDLYNYFLNGSK